jgi:enoyl-CoA hydratase/carnithine racemase
MPDRGADPVIVERLEPWLAIITLNREEVRNAISRQMATMLVDRLSELSADEQIRALVITGAGDKSFSAGADLKERHKMTASQRARHTESIREIADRLYAFQVPVVAAIRGYALAGGAELAIACDFRIAGENAVLGFPEVKRGIFPGAGAVERLPRLVGSSWARRLLFTGRQIDANEALTMGLVDSVAPVDYVFSEAKRICRDVASQSPAAIRRLKRAIIASESAALDAAREQINHIRAELDAGDDYEEGLAAFAEKRQPRWTLTSED